MSPHGLTTPFSLVLNHIPLPGCTTDMMKFGREDKTKATVREEGRLRHGKSFVGLRIFVVVVVCCLFIFFKRT